MMIGKSSRIPLWPTSDSGHLYVKYCTLFNFSVCDVLNYLRSTEALPVMEAFRNHKKTTIDQYESIDFPNHSYLLL